MNPLRLGFRICDRRYPFLWHRPGQPVGRWNRAGDQPVHYLASTPTVAWAEWIHHQELDEPADRAGVAAALWAVLIPANWGNQDLQAVPMAVDAVLDPTAAGQEARLALVEQLKRHGAEGLLAPTSAPHQSHEVSPCVRVMDEEGCSNLLPLAAHVILLWCNAERLPGRCCVPEGRPGAELLPLALARCRITVMSDHGSWLNNSLLELIAALWRRDHVVRCIHDPALLGQGKVCLLLSYSRLLSAEQLALNRHNLVVHESALPQSQVWSPITLFEATTELDAGPLIPSWIASTPWQSSSTCCG